jgi:hypothetical protein
VELIRQPIFTRFLKNFNLVPILMHSKFCLNFIKNRFWKVFLSTGKWILTQQKVNFLLQVGISTILLNYSVISCIDGDAEAQVQCLNVAFLLLEGISDAESKFRTLVRTLVILINPQLVLVTYLNYVPAIKSFCFGLPVGN